MIFCSGHTRRANGGRTRNTLTSKEKYSDGQTLHGFHINEWVSSEARFIDPELWNINPTLRQELPDFSGLRNLRTTGPVFGGSRHGGCPFGQIATTCGYIR